MAGRDSQGRPRFRVVSSTSSAGSARRSSSWSTRSAAPCGTAAC